MENQVSHWVVWCNVITLLLISLTNCLPIVLVYQLCRPFYYNWEGTLHLAQGLVQSFAFLLLFSVVWSAALHHLPQDKMHNCNHLLLNTFVNPNPLMKILVMILDIWFEQGHSVTLPWVLCFLCLFWFDCDSFFPSPCIHIKYIILIFQTPQVVSARTQPSQQSSGLALLERLLGQELHSHAWHLLISRNTHKYHTHGYLLLPPFGLYLLY